MITTKGNFRDERGLSLGEMLVVVAVFSVLIVVMVVSSTTVTIKTRTSRVKQEHQVIASAVDRYQAEKGIVPTRLDQLVVPIPYLPEVPPDPFAPTRELPYRLIILPQGSGLTPHALIISRGPDGDFDYDQPKPRLLPPIAADGPSSTGPRTPLVTADQIFDSLDTFSYDPTNGSLSNGDIIRFNRSH